MDKSDFRKWSHKASDWSADYLETLTDRPVRAQVRPGDIGRLIGESPPQDAHAMDEIFADFERIIPDGMTHWQHPRFFAYFPSNAAPAAVIAEQLATAIGAQCMLWQTSPAATELEVRMVDWLRQALGLPEDYKGTFQDTASSATLCAVLTMRERALDWSGNRTGCLGTNHCASTPPRGHTAPSTRPCGCPAWARTILSISRSITAAPWTSRS